MLYCGVTMRSFKLMNNFLDYLFELFDKIKREEEYQDYDEEQMLKEKEEKDKN
jgi:hypothetical protein